MCDAFVDYIICIGVYVYYMYIIFHLRGPPRVAAPEATFHDGLGNVFANNILENGRHWGPLNRLYGELRGFSVVND